MDSALVTVISNLGWGGVVLILMVLGYLVPKPAHTRALEDSARKDQVIGKLQDALDLERQRSNDATQAGAVTNQLIGGLLALAERQPSADHSGNVRIPGLTAKDQP